jgi:hypothetical protein
MNDYLPFVDRLDNHLKAYQGSSRDQWQKDGVRFVNGLAAEELRRLVGIEKRREFGAFFTNSDLALELFANPQLQFGDNCTIYDPAVGAGNLLIAANVALHNKVQSLTLVGTDLHPEFIRAAKLRLAITSLLTEPTAKAIQPVIDMEVGDGLADNSYYAHATHIITNPPFNLIDGCENITWGSGKLSAAAVFIDRIIRFVKPGTPIIAILPDVLRSGSRYEKWRAMVEENCTISNLTMLGQFDKFADVDVFSIVFTKRLNPNDGEIAYRWSPGSKHDRVVSDLFDVSVGNVVDNRDPHEGVLRPFLVSRGLPGWHMVKNISKERQFKGQAIDGPFVVVKRTSRMGDQRRAIATIINAHTPVYVDNHLIVLKPKSGKLADCELLVKKLESNQTDEWINEQIRCRHLTVKIVMRIPV